MSIGPGRDDVAADPAAAVQAAADRSHALAAGLGAGGMIGEQLELPPVPAASSKHTGPPPAED